MRRKGLFEVLHAVLGMAITNLYALTGIQGGYVVRAMVARSTRYGCTYGCVNYIPESVYVCA